MRQVTLGNPVVEYGVTKATNSALIGGIKYSEFLLDAGASNTLIGLRLIVNPLDLIEAEEAMVARDSRAKIVNLSSQPIFIDSNRAIKSFALMALSSASSTPATTPANTLFGISPTETTASTVATAMRLLSVDQNIPGKRLCLSTTGMYGSGRYAILKVEVTIDV